MNYSRFPGLLRGLNIPGMLSGPTVCFAADEDGGAPAAEPAGGASTEPAAAPPEAVEGETPPDAAAAEGAEGAESGEQEPQRPTRVPWQVKRIGELTAEKKGLADAAAAEKARADAAEARAASYEALYGKPDGTPAPAPAAAPDGERRYTEVEVAAEAARRANLAALDQRCETLFNDGKKAHGAAWQARIDQAGLAFGDQLRQRGDFFEALTSLPNAADVYHALTGDLDHLGEVLAMNPVQLGMELAKMSTAAAAKPKGSAVSRTPAPISPIEGGDAGADETDLAKMPMDQFAKTREAQRLERAKARGY